MFCTECGTKLDDSASFCTNCGHKMEVAETVTQSLYTEPVVSMSQSTGATNTAAYSEPQTVYGAEQNVYGTNQDMYGANQNTYGTNQDMYGANQNAYGANQNVYGANQNVYGANQNTYGTYPTYSPEPKKKGKGCLIAVIVGSVIGIIAVLLIVMAVLFGASLLGGKKDGVEEIYGYWTGSSTLVSVSGEDELQEYLEDLYGRPLTNSEIEGLCDTSYDDFMDINIYEYEDDYGDYFPGSWNMNLYMGSFFGTQNWDDWDAMSYYEFENQPDAGCIKLDSNGTFEVEVTETDYLGEYGCVFFDTYNYDVEDWEVMEDGEYGITFTGKVTENASGEKQIEGEIIISFEYGDMSKPYVMTYEYVLDNCSEY